MIVKYENTTSKKERLALSVLYTLVVAMGDYDDTSLVDFVEVTGEVSENSLRRMAVIRDGISRIIAKYN